MSRFYVRPEDVRGSEIRVSKEEAHHILDVMRMARGDRITAFDGTGKEYEGVIINDSRDDLRIKVDKVNIAVADKKFHVTLAQAIPKKAKMDLIVEKATELGVDEIIPVISERTIARPSEEKSGGKTERWRDIAITASKQCGRPDVPKIAGVIKYAELLKRMKDYDLVMIAFLGHDTKPLKKIISGFKGGKILAMVGPEGDFSPQEIKAALANGAAAVSLGRLVLKSDTAGIFILSVLSHENSSV